MTLRWVPGWNGLTEPEAVEYVAAVEEEDGEPLEFGVAKAINDFVLGCKNDGIWDAIKASCILAGARTLSGALVPLVGAAPTNFNFVAGDYNRETGLVADGSTKYLDSNRAANSDPQNSAHACVYVSTAANAGTHLGAVDSTPSVNRMVQIGPDNSQDIIAARSTAFFTGNTGRKTGLIGVNRSAASSFSVRWNSTNPVAITSASLAPGARNIFVFALNLNGSVADRGSSRLAFYSIGESLDLALLEARVTTLINAIGAAIP